MTDLISRIERAGAGCRKLDQDIFCDLGLAPLVEGAFNSYHAPHYTTSIDAALTLVPEGFDWAIFHTNGGLTIHAWCGNREDVFGETPALALCAAALKARQEDRT